MRSTDLFWRNKLSLVINGQALYFIIRRPKADSCDSVSFCSFLLAGLCLFLYPVQFFRRYQRVYSSSVNGQKGRDSFVAFGKYFYFYVL